MAAATSKAIDRPCWSRAGHQPGTRVLPVAYITQTKERHGMALKSHSHLNGIYDSSKGRVPKSFIPKPMQSRRMH